MRKKQQARVFTSAVTTGYKWNSDATMKKRLDLSLDILTSNEQKLVTTNLNIFPWVYLLCEYLWIQSNLFILKINYSLQNWSHKFWYQMWVFRLLFYILIILWKRWNQEKTINHTQDRSSHIRAKLADFSVYLEIHQAVLIYSYIPQTKNPSLFIDYFYLVEINEVFF